MILAPKFEKATELWYPWLTSYLPGILDDLGLTYVILAGATVNRETVWNEIRAHGPRLILGVGHGNETTYTGQDYETIFLSCNYPPELLEGRNFSPVSCLVGLDLVPDMERKGLGAGLGEDIEYAFWYTSGVDPLQDPTLGSFVKSEFTYTMALGQGIPHAAAWQVMRGAYYKAAESQPPHVASTLKKDADHRLKFGDEDWRLVEGEPPEPPQEKKIVLDGYLSLTKTLKFPIHLEGVLEE
jgi:hypothetical protein